MKTIPAKIVKTAALAAAVGTLAIAAAAALSGCNTVKGVGKDVQSAGQAGQDAIDNAGNKK
jgi:predicted small secreted protein